MRPLSRVQNLLFRLGALLMVAGAAAYLFGGVVPNILFVVGVLLFAAMQVQTVYEGGNIVVRRLRRQQLLGATALVLSALAQTCQTLGCRVLGRGEWVVFLLVGGLLELYTAFRIPQELDKENRRGGLGMGAVCLLLLLLSSCADKYMVDGSTSVHGMEGKMLYLKVFQGGDLKSMDSCCVTHGKFSFSGNMDSTVMANLFLGSQSLMPVVIEGGDIVLKIDEVAQTVTGSPLNDSLYHFIQRKTQIDNQLAELPRREGRMVMDGMEHDEVVARLAAEAQRLRMEGDALVTTFIKRNYNNVLGPGIFMIMTSEYAYPVLTPQIEELIVGAPAYFLGHPYVEQYLRVANENMEKLQRQ